MNAFIRILYIIHIPILLSPSYKQNSCTLLIFYNKNEYNIPLCILDSLTGAENLDLFCSMNGTKNYQTKSA